MRKIHGIGALLALFGVGCMIAYAQSTPTGTLFPNSLDNNTTLPAQVSLETITAAWHNTHASATRAVQVALGADPTWATKNLLTRLSEKAGAADNNLFLGNNSFKQLNGTLNALIYAGADIGARTNAAIADCDAKNGVGGWCRIIIPPSNYTQSTPINLSRGNTEIDCQGATLTTAGSFEDAPIRVNFEDGQIGDGLTTDICDESAQTGGCVDITVRNCTIDNSAQTSASNLSAETFRTGRVIVWQVQRLTLENIRIIDSFGPGVQVFHSTGTVRGIGVDTGRTNLAYPYSNSIFLRGAGNFAGEGSTGTQLAASDLEVTDTAGGGIALLGGVRVSGVRVNDSTKPCVTIGPILGSWVGWIDLSDFSLADCGTNGSALSSIDDLAGAGSDVDYVSISNGRIRRSVAGGIRMANAFGYHHVSVSNVVVECYGSGFASAPGIAVGSLLYSPADSQAVSVVGSQVTTTDTCPDAALGDPTGITVHGDGGVISNNTIGLIQGATAADAGEGIIYAGSNGAITGNVVRFVGEAAVKLDAAGGNIGGINITGNVFESPCGVGSSCGIFHFETGTTQINGVLIQANRGQVSPGHVIETTIPLGGWVTDVHLTGNFFSLADEDILHNDDDNADIFFGEVVGGVVRSRIGFRKLNSSGAAIGAGEAVCLNLAGTDGIDVGECGTGTAKDLVLGVAASSIANGEWGEVVVLGEVTVGCDGVVTRGELIEISGTTQGRVTEVSSPTSGGVLGKALTNCVSNSLLAYIFGGAGG